VSFDLFVHLEPQSPIIQGDLVEITARTLDRTTGLSVDPDGAVSVVAQPPAPATQLQPSVTKLAVGQYRAILDTSAVTGDYEIEVIAVDSASQEREQRWIRVKASLATPTDVIPTVYDGGAPDAAFANALDGGTPSTVYSLIIDGGTP
jgi:hypothetical protein